MKKIILILLAGILPFSMNSFAQNTGLMLTVSKRINQEKVKQIDPNSYFK